MKRNLSHLIFWCCCSFHETKAKKQGKKEEQKKQGRSKQKKQGKKRETRKKKKRERECEKAKWMKPRRKKGRHRAVNKNNPFSKGKTVFCKKTTKTQKEKKGLGLIAPKHTCNPKPKKKTQKRAKHEKKSRGVSRDPFSNSRKGCRKKNPEKLGKTLRTAAARPFVATGPTRTQNATHPRTKNFTNWYSPGKKGKKVILKTTSALQPQAVFCLPNPIWSKIRTSDKTNVWDPQNLFSKTSCRIEAIQRVQREVPKRKIAPKHLVLKRFASYYLLEPAEENRFSGNCKKNISRYKNSGFKKGGAAKRPFGGRILTHETRKRGPYTCWWEHNWKHQHRVRQSRCCSPTNAIFTQHLWFDEGSELVIALFVHPRKRWHVAWERG